MGPGSVVRSRVTFDTWPPRDLLEGETAYVHRVEHDDDVCAPPGDCWFHLVSLERPGKRFTLLFRHGMRPERWFEILA